MKKILLSSVALLGLTVVATAADLPRRVAPAPYVPVAPAFTWTGFYVGVNAGYGFTDHHDDDCWGGGFGFGGCGFSNLSTLSVPTFPNGALVPVGPVVSPAFNNFGSISDNRRDGFVGGGQIGYNYQFTPGSGLVIGIEADAQYNGTGRRHDDKNNWWGFWGGANAFNGFATAPVIAPFGPGFPGPSWGVAPTVPGALGNIALFNSALGNGWGGGAGWNDRDKRSEFLGTVRGRLGWAFDRLLIYATGGVAFTGSDHNNNNNCWFAGCGFGFNGGGFASGAAVPANFFISGPAAVNGSRVLPTTTTAFPSFDRNRDNDVRAVVGGGLEYAFTNNLTAKIEGLYVFGNNRNNDNNWLGFGGTGGGIVGVTNTGAAVFSTGTNAGFGLTPDHRRRDDLTIVRAGVNYKFNWW